MNGEKKAKKNNFILKQNRKAKKQNFENIMKYVNNHARH